MTKICLVLLVLIGGSVVRAEDVTRIRIVHYQPPIPKAESGIWPEKYDTTTLWIGRALGCNKRTNLQFYTVVNLSSGQMMKINPKFEIYQVYDRAGMWRHDTSQTESARDFAIGIALASPDIVVSIRRTLEQDTIRNELCHKYELEETTEYGASLRDMWISDRECTFVESFFFTYLDMSFFLTGHESLEQSLKQIRGLPMLETSRGLVRRTSEIVSIDTASVDSTFFNIPAGYEEYKE